ncbi:hypothetical protein M3P21_22285, partial [Ruegeria sp. 2012CJ41-6]
GKKDGDYAASPSYVYNSVKRANDFFDSKLCNGYRVHKWLPEGYQSDPQGSFADIILHFNTPVEEVDYGAWVSDVQDVFSIGKENPAKSPHYSPFKYMTGDENLSSPILSASLADWKILLSAKASMDAGIDPVLLLMQTQEQ